MGQKFTKARVLDRLKVALVGAYREETAKASKYKHDVKAYPKQRIQWERAVVKWFAGEIHRGNDSASGQGYRDGSDSSPRPVRPSEPTEPYRGESEEIKSLISQVQCAAGDEIYLANNVFIHLARYL